MSTALRIGSQTKRTTLWESLAILARDQCWPAAQCGVSKGLRPSLARTGAEIGLLRVLMLTDKVKETTVSAIEGPAPQVHGVLLTRCASLQVPSKVSWVGEATHSWLCCPDVSADSRCEVPCLCGFGVAPSLQDPGLVWNGIRQLRRLLPAGIERDLGHREGEGAGRRHPCKGQGQEHEPSQALGFSTGSFGVGIAAGGA